MQQPTILVAPDFCGVICALDVDRTRIPVVFLAPHIGAACEQQDAFTRRRQPIGQRATASTAADDDDVVVLCHGVLPGLFAALL
jgi:hypothetical protein